MAERREANCRASKTSNRASRTSKLNWQELQQSLPRLLRELCPLSPGDTTCSYHKFALSNLEPPNPAQDGITKHTVLANMSSSDIQAQVGRALVDFAVESQYPDEEDVGAAKVESSALPTALDLLNVARVDLEVVQCQCLWPSIRFPRL